MNEIKKRLEEQIKTLEYELKVELPREIKKAREHGDLRENAEYHAAKERQSFVDARVNQLRRRVAALSMANLDKIPRDKVGLGSTVHLKDVDSGEEVVYEIVTPEESDPSTGRISPSSPIGRSLIGKEEGDEIEVRAPAGVREYELTRLQTMYDQVEESSGES
jgi:transcription elongation factor GreA